MPLSCAAARPSAICTAIVERLARRQRARCQRVAQRLAVEQLRHDVRRAVVHADVVHREDVRMVQRRGGSRFLLEALQPVGIGARRSRENLDRDVAPEARVARAIDLAHPARAEQRIDFVGTEMDTGCERHVEKGLRRCYANPARRLKPPRYGDGDAPMGTRRLNSSNQLMTTLTCVAGGSGSLGVIIRKRRPSRETS